MGKEYVLITGATGFIGSHIVEKILLDRSYPVVAIIRRIKGYKNTEELENRGAILVEGNFYDVDLLNNVFQKYPIQNVIHIAALRGGGAGTKEDYHVVNVLGTERLLYESLKHQVKKFIFCSSVGVFGTIPKELPANVMTDLNGDNEYHNSKILAEKKVKDYINKGLNAYIIRPTITYGKGDNGFPMTLMGLVKKRGLLLPFKDIKIHLLNVANFAELFILIIKSENSERRTFIAADEGPISLKELVNLIHFHYYKTDYPYFLKLPDFIFRCLSMVFKLFGNEKWLTRILLISKSWYFETGITNNTFQWLPAKTADSFIESMYT